jgi:hypothetical protein
MLDLEDTHKQNVRERIQRNGMAAKIERQAYLEQLKSHMGPPTNMEAEPISLGFAGLQFTRTEGVQRVRFGESLLN